MDVSLCKERLQLSFSDVTYSVKDTGGKRKTILDGVCAAFQSGEKRKTILDGVCGTFQSGRLTAILGPSGAGKTTLLNVLSGFKVHGIRGTISLNGEPRNSKLFQKQACYITQEIALLENLTANETLLVAARLKLGEGYSDHRRRQMVSEILKRLGLERTTDTRVSHMSGGERKRLSIGLELLTNPPFMFFDEPTSGLDSASSVLMVNLMKSLALSGRAVVCTLHQPNSKIFSMLDDVLLLAHGKVLFCGPTDQLIPAFESAGFPCPQFYNPADFALEVASHERGHNLDQLVVNCKLAQHTAHQEKSFLSDVVDTGGEYEAMLPSSESSSDDTVVEVEHPCRSKKYAVSCCNQFSILLYRSLLCTFRDRHLARFRFATHVVIGLVLGAIYYDIGNDASKIHNNSSYIFFSILFIFFSNSMPTVHSVPLEATVFLREHLNNWYSLTSYFFAKLLSDIPLQIICPTVFLLFSYFLTAQPLEVTRVLMLWVVCMLLAVVAQMTGLVTGAACNMQSGVFVVAVSSIPMLLFSGFFIRLSDIPIYFKFLAYLSYFRYAFQASILAIYGFERPTLICSVPYCNFKSPRKFLQELEMKEDVSFWCCITGLVIWIVFLQIALFVVLKWRLRKAR